MLAALMLHKFGPFELDEHRFELRRKGKPVQVQRRVLETIAYLVRHRNRLVTKEDLITGPWRGRAVNEDVLTHTVMLARKVLADRPGPGRPQMIQTVRGKGYRFVAEVVTTDVPTTAGGPDSERRPAPTFLGRERELEAMKGAAARAGRGRGGLVLMGGVPGIGKTSLLERFARSSSGADIFWGRCWEVGGAPAFWPWFEILRGYVERYGDQAISLMGTGAPDIAHLLPELRQWVPKSSVPPPDPESPQARFRTFDSVSRFLCAAANSHPLILLIDDLHAADDASVLLLQFLSRMLDKARLLIVASYRDLEIRSRPLLTSFLGGPIAHAVPLTLSGLTEAHVAALLSARLGQSIPADFASRVRKATDGNPFLVGELGQTLLACAPGGRLDASQLDAFRIPERVADIVRRHLKRLPPAACTALSIASVLGREFSLGLLRELSGTHADRGIDDLEAALVDGVIKDSLSAPGTYTFSHALVRETLYHDLPPAERLALHFATAECLKKKDVTASATIFQIAHHYFLAAPHKGAAKALEWALRAADKARGLFAYELAAEHYQHALQMLDLLTPDETKRCEILLELADAERLAGKAGEAIATFEKVESIGRARGNPQVLGKALLGIVEVMRDGALTHETLHVRVDTALQSLPAEDSILRARLLGALLIAGYLKKTATQRLALYDEAINMARRLDDPETLAMVLHSSHWTLSQGTRPERALDAATEMIAVAQRANHAEKLLDGKLWRASYLLVLGRRNDFEAELEEYDRLAKRLHHPLHIWWAQVGSCNRALMDGRFAEAENLAKDLLTTGLPLQGLIAESVFAIQMLTSSLEKDSESRRQAIQEVMQIIRKILQLVPSHLAWRVPLVLTQLEAGMVAEARANFDRLAEEGFEKIPDDQVLLVLLACLSKIACAFSDSPRARKLYELLKPHAGRHLGFASVSAYWGPVSHYLGLLAVVLGDGESARVHYENAIAESTAMRAPVWVAWSEYEFGNQLRTSARASERKRGKELLRSALHTAQRLGLARLERTSKIALRGLR